MNLDRVFEDFAFLQRLANDPEKMADLLKARIRDGERIAELEAEVERLTHELAKVTKKLTKTRQTIRRMEEGEL